MRTGAEREIHDLGQRLGARGHQVRLITSQPDGATSHARFGALDVRYVRVPAMRRAAQRGWDETARFGATAAALAGWSRADLIHAWHYADAGMLARLPGVRRDRPVVLKVTGTVVPDRIRQRPVHDRLMREALETVDEVWCNSRFAAAEMSGFDVPMHVVPAGIDAGRFFPGGLRAPQPTVLCTSAPDDPRKRVVDVIDAWPHVLGEVPGARLVLAGDARRSQQRLLERLPREMRDTVTMTGVLGDDELVEAYRSAWVAVSPSVQEALGLTTLEALACGTPVVGADSGATSELLAGTAVGELYSPSVPEDLAEAVVSWLDTPPSPTIVTWCLNAMAPYAWEAIVDGILTRYAALLDARR